MSLDVSAFGSGFLGSSFGLARLASSAAKLKAGLTGAAAAFCTVGLVVLLSVFEVPGFLPTDCRPLKKPDDFACTVLVLVAAAGVVEVAGLLESIGFLTLAKVFDDGLDPFVAGVTTAAFFAGAAEGALPAAVEDLLTPTLESVVGLVCLPLLLDAASRTFLA